MLSKLMSSIKLSFGKVVSVCTKTALTKMVTVGVTFLVAGGTITGIIVYSNSVIGKAPVEENAQVLEIDNADETIVRSNEQNQITPEQSAKMAEETAVAVAVAKANEEAKAAETKTSETSNTSNGGGSEIQPVGTQPTPEPTPEPTPAPAPIVTHKAAGYNADLTTRVNQAMIDGGMAAGGSTYNSFKNYILNGGAMPVVDFPSSKSTGEVRQSHIVLDETISNLAPYFTRESEASKVSGQGGAVCAKVSCDGNGNANVTLYTLVMVSK